MHWYNPKLMGVEDVHPAPSTDEEALGRCSAAT